MTTSTDRRDVNQIRNVLANWGAFVVIAFAGLFVSPKIVAALGDTTYGVWALVGSLVGPLGFLDFGVRSAVTRLVARLVALGQHDEASRMASTARLLYGISASIALVVCLVLALGMQRWFKIPPELATTAPTVLAIVGVSLAVSLVTGLYGGILTGLQRLDLIGFSDMAIEAARVPVILVVLWAGGGIVGLALINLGLAIVRYAYQRYAARRIYPELHLRIFKPARQDVATIMEISAFAAIIYSLGTVTARVDMYVIGAHLPLAMVTFYAIGGTLPSYVQAMSLPIARNVLPMASHLEATANADELRQLVLDSGRYGALVLLPMVLAFITSGPTFLAIWMGPEYRGASGPVLIVLSLPAIFGLARHVLQTVFVGTGHHRHLAPWYLAESIVTIGLCIVFVRMWGIIGAAWAVVIPSAIVAAVLFPILITKHYGISVPRLWMQLWLRPLAALMPYAATTWALDRLWPPTGYLMFFGQIAASLPVALVGALAIGLDRRERQLFRDWTARRIRGVSAMMGRA